MSNRDHFAFNSGGYRQFRPQYPAELAAWLAQQAPSRSLAWDVGTGSGQAAVSLAPHFGQVYASDPSAAQIALAQPHARVRYAVEAAEACSLENASADLITVATAFHWLDREAFCRQVSRVLRPGGVLAVWAYHQHRVTPEIDEWIVHLQQRVLGPHWPRGIESLMNGYRDLALPVEPITAPAFEIEQEMAVDDFLGYVRTWSGVDRYRQTLGRDPVDLNADTLRALWGSQRRKVRWPLVLMAGRLPT